MGLQGTRLSESTAEFLRKEYTELEIDKNLAGQSSSLDASSEEEDEEDEEDE